jgi:hypothetical protein
MSKHRNDLFKASSTLHQPKLTLWDNLNEDEQAAISGGVFIILPWDIIRIRTRGSVPHDEVAL